MIITNKNTIKQSIANIELEGLKIPDNIKKMLAIGMDTNDIIKRLKLWGDKMSEGYRDITKELSEQDHGTIEEDLWHKETIDGWGG